MSARADNLCCAWSIASQRSPAFNAGAHAGIRQVIDGKQPEPLYAMGTAECDAWEAGVQFGLSLVDDSESLCVRALQIAHAAGVEA